MGPSINMTSIALNGWRSLLAIFSINIVFAFIVVFVLMDTSNSGNSLNIKLVPIGISKINQTTIHSKIINMNKINGTNSLITLSNGMNITDTHNIAKINDEILLNLNIYKTICSPLINDSNIKLLNNTVKHIVLNFDSRCNSGIRGFQVTNWQVENTK